MPPDDYKSPRSVHPQYLSIVPRRSYLQGRSSLCHFAGGIPYNNPSQLRQKAAGGDNVRPDTRLHISPQLSNFHLQEVFAIFCQH